MNKKFIKILSIFMMLFFITNYSAYAEDTVVVDTTNSTGETVGGEPQIRTLPVSQGNIPEEVSKTNPF